MQTRDPAGIGQPPFWLGGHIGAIAPFASTLRPGAVPAAVNPTAAYSTEPAPMGIGDFGINFSGSADTYYTDAFRSTAAIRTFSTTANLGGFSSNDSSFQLNVVVVLSRGSALAEYWIQDVPILNSSSHFIQIENNVWNFSSPGAQLPTNSIRGNGTVYTASSGSGTVQYYADGASSGYPGAGTTLTLPVNISAEVTASNLSGTTHVGFAYDDGYGWVTYDNVTFPWTHGWTLRGFEVNGAAYNPFGLFNDAEWIVGGPGGGSSMRVQRANMTMSLEEFNGHNFEAIPDAYNFGSDTAETASNVVALPRSGTAAGTPSDSMTAGAGSLKFIYGAGNVSTLNVSAPVVNGTFLAAGEPTDYRGHTANLTLLPGTYLLAVENQTSIVAAKNETLTAHQYLPLSFAAFAIAPGKSPGQQRVTAKGGGFIAASTVSVTWPGNSTAQCQATAASNGSFSCSFLVPLVPAGTYNLTASDNAASDDVAWTIFVVTTNLTVGAAASSASTDLGGTLRFWANATGGFPPYTSFVWAFGDGVVLHTTVGTTNYTYPRAGAFSLSVTVRDKVGDSLSANVAVRIRPDPTVSGPQANRSAADVGQSVSFSVVGSAGLGPYQFAWSGLPAGCQVAGAAATCVNLSSPGNYSVFADITDSEGYVSVGPALTFRVYADPLIALVTDRRPYLDANENLSLSVDAVFGSGGFVYTWSGLPVGCAPLGSQVDCRVSAAASYLVGVLATDSNGVGARSLDLAVIVAPDPAVRLTSSAQGSSDLGQPTGLLAEASGGSGAISYRWTGLPTGCASANLSALPCAPTATGAFWIGVTIVDQSGASASANLSYSVYSYPTVHWVSASATSEDVGRPITFVIGGSGGDGPLRYAWVNLPTGCASQDSDLIPCVPSAPGSFEVYGNATDANNATATTSTILESIAVRPSVVRFSASPTEVVAGYPVTFSAQLSGGTGAFTYLWHQLPAGCDPRNLSTVTCRPSASGAFSVSVVVTDGVGVSANATTHMKVVAAILGLAPTEGYATILLGLAGLGGVLAIVVRWVRRSGPRQGTPDPDEAP